MPHKVTMSSGNAKDYNLDIFNCADTKYKNGLWKSPELAAYAFGQQYNALSISKNREYGAVIISVPYKVSFVYTWKHVYKGGKKHVVNMWMEAVISNSLKEIKLSNNFIGTVHTHSSCADSEGKWSGNGYFFFSPNDMKFLPGKKYLVSPDGSLHYAEGKPSKFVNRHPKGMRGQPWYEERGWWYGEIVGYGLPSDPLCVAYRV